MTHLQSENDVELLNKIKEKLAPGLDSTDKLTKKAYEYLRLLKIKRGGGLANMSDSCAVVLCLHLAAETLSYTFDKSLAIKLASVSKRNYTTLYHTVKKVLGLDRPVSIDDLCLKLECSEVSGLAERIIKEYVIKRDKGLLKCPPIDLTHPMYACAAVMAAARLKRVHVKRGPLVEMCRVKAKELDRLAGELAALIEPEKPLTRKRNYNPKDTIYISHPAKMEIREIEYIGEELLRCIQPGDEATMETFEAWRNRILH